MELRDWLRQQAEAAENEHVRPEIRELVKRGNVTLQEVTDLRCNSWEWEALIPAMNDEAFTDRLEHALSNCSTSKRRPFSVYDDAVVGLFAPELLRRFQAMAREAMVFAETIDAIRTALGQRHTHYLVMPGDVKTAIKALEWYAAPRFEEHRAHRARLALALIRGDTIETTCESCNKKLIVELPKRPEDEPPAVFCAACGGGCVGLPPEEVLP